MKCLRGLHNLVIAHRSLFRSARRSDDFPGLCDERVGPFTLERLRQRVERRLRLRAEPLELDKDNILAILNEHIGKRSNPVVEPKVQMVWIKVAGSAGEGDRFVQQTELEMADVS